MRVSVFAAVVSLAVLFLAARAQVVERELFHGHMTTDTFLDQYFDREWFLLRRYSCQTNDAELDQLHNDSTPVCDGFEEGTTARMVAAKLIESQPPSAFQVRAPDGKPVNAGALFNSGEPVEAIVDAILADGNSIVYKPELATEDSIIDFEINVALEQLLQVAISTHVYISSRGINALKPHTDVRVNMRALVSATAHCLPLALRCARAPGCRPEALAHLRAQVALQQVHRLLDNVGLAV